eukprot:m.129513 g.129513  ORF g.129513 m.129513 type:complete len:109 (+) comp14578_c0_seq4:2650-2976(+)
MYLDLEDIDLEFELREEEIEELRELAEHQDLNNHLMEQQMEIEEGIKMQILKQRRNLELGKYLSQHQTRTRIQLRARNRRTTRNRRASATRSRAKFNTRNGTPTGIRN